MKRDEVIDKAYGNIPKEVGINLEMNWLPTRRGIKFYYHKIVRYFTR